MNNVRFYFACDICFSLTWGWGGGRGAKEKYTAFRELSHDDPPQLLDYAGNNGILSSLLVNTCLGWGCL